MTSRAAVCPQVSAALLVGTVVVVGAITPGYHSNADTVSRLGSPGQPYATVARAAFVLYGLLVLAGVPAVDRPSRLVRWYGVAAIVAGLAPKDAPGAPHTALSALHVDATIVGGVAIVAAMVAVGLDGGRQPASRQTALAAAGVTLLAAMAFRLCWGSPVYGLVERALVAAPAVWVAFGVHRLTCPDHVQEDEQAQDQVPAQEGQSRQEAQRRPLASRRRRPRRRTK